MSNAIAMKPGLDLEKLVVNGDVSQLSPEQKSQYYILRCKQHGLDPSSQPFNYLNLKGKHVLYANKGCAEQLRSIHKVSIKITKAEQVGDLFVVIAEAKDGSGREDSDVGAVPINGLRGEELANAIMKAQTKAKRRVTLSICGLNMLDESEVETLANRVAPQQPEAGDGVQREGNPLKYGKHYGQHPDQVSPQAAYEACEAIKQERKGKALLSAQQDFVNRCGDKAQAYALSLPKQVEVTPPEEPQETIPVTCDCGTELGHWEAKKLWICKDYKNKTVQHLKPISESEYARILAESSQEPGWDG